MASKQAWWWWPSVHLHSGKGGQINGAACPTQKAAHEARLEMIENAKRTKTVGTATLREATEAHITHLLEESGGSEVTAQGYRYRFARWFLILNPEASVLDVLVEDVRYLIRERRERHGVADNGILQDLRVLHAVFATAGIAPVDNPARRWHRLHAPGGIKWPREKKPRRASLTMDRVGELERAIRGSSKPAAALHADLVRFLAVTGIREYEIGRLRADDVDYE